MKVSVYIEDGTEQINLTPESEFERQVLDKIRNKKYNISFREGRFTKNDGRISYHSTNQFNNEPVFIVLTKKEEEENN